MKIPLILGIACLAIVLITGAIVSDFVVYLGDDPSACNNCHVMDAVYEGWYHASHSRWATCNDCHTPHDFIPKYFIKAKSGFNHVTAFTFGKIPDAIRAHPEARNILQENCIRCHSETVSMISDGMPDAGRFCFDCHRTVAHGERGISILPYQDKGKYVFPYQSQEKP